jgi:hypothetical protein
MGAPLLLLLLVLLVLLLGTLTSCRLRPASSCRASRVPLLLLVGGRRQVTA